MKVTIKTRLHLTIFCATLFIIFSSCSSNSENVATLNNPTEIGNPNIHRYEVDDFGVVGNRYKVPANSINVAIDAKDKPVSKKTYPFNIDIKNTNSAYWPSGASVRVVFNGVSKTFSDIRFLTVGVDYPVVTSNVDGNTLEVFVACYSLETKIYENSKFNVNDCPKYLLNFYMTAGSLECNVFTTKNSVICVRE